MALDKMEDFISDSPQTPEDAAEMWDAIFDRLTPQEPTEEDRDRAAEERGDP